MHKSIVIFISAFLLSACGEDVRIAKLHEKPSITDVGIIDGCSVKFVDRGRSMESFFMAKCGTTSTTTSNFSVSHGKTSSDERITVITSEIDKLTNEKKLITRTEVALSKLTADERKLFEQK